MQNLWIVTVPNTRISSGSNSSTGFSSSGSSSSNSDETFRALSSNMKSLDSTSQLHRFELPTKQLNVGTLDSLLALSDELVKICSSSDNVRHHTLSHNNYF